MAAHLLALYNAPHDPTHFEQYYFGTHVPIAKQLPGLMSYRVSKGALAAPDGAPPYYLIAILEFESLAAIEAALASPEGKATVEDVPKFATGGLALVTYETQTV